MPSVRNRQRRSVAARIAAHGPAGGDGPLVEAIAAGEPSALAEAYTAHASRVHALVRGLCGPAAADVLTQESFLQLWRSPQRYNADLGTLRGFLLLQAHRRAVEMLRSHTNCTASAFDDDVRPYAQRAEADAAALALHEQAEVDEHVAALPDIERHPIVLAYFGGHTYREIARILSVPEGAIKCRIRDGLLRLRTELSEHPT